MRNADHPRNIVLVGPMGAGKSEVGRLLAARLGLAFVDIDERVEADAGRPVAAIFAGDGEAAFREREGALLEAVLARDGQVVATGGGAVLADANRSAMRTGGRVVYLQVGPQEQLRRLAGALDRPLLATADRGRRLAELQALREPLYRGIADLVQDTDGRSPAEVAAAVAGMLGREGETPA